MTLRLPNRTRLQRRTQRRRVGQQAIEILDAELASAVTGRALGVGVDLDEEGIHSTGHGGAGQRLNEAAVAAARKLSGARMLHRVGGIQTHRSEVAHGHEAAHVDDEVVVPEGRPPLGNEHPRGAEAVRLLDGVTDVTRNELSSTT